MGKKVFLVIWGLIPICLYAQKRNLVLQNVQKDTIYLPQKPILPGSLEVTVNDTTLNSFIPNYLDGTIVIQKGNKKKVEIEYEVLNIDTHFRLPMTDQTTKIHTQITSTKKSRLEELSIKNIFYDSKILTSGIIERRVTLGTLQNLTMSSGMRIQVNGEIAPGVHINASLSDENLPIQSEGTTQTLQELDKVFVKLSSKHLQATVGDFNFSNKNTTFGRIERSVQGASVSAERKSGMFSTGGAAVLAFSRGKFTNLEFNGVEGVQGPYRLSVGSQTLVTVIAGTETVYVNGVKQERGETEDYIINYATGEIFFKPRRLITYQSKIFVRFQYVEKNYPRTFVGAIGRASFRDSLASLNFSYLGEIDNEKNPFSFTLNNDLLKRVSEEKSGEFVDTSFYNSEHNGGYIRKFKDGVFFLNM